MTLDQIEETMAWAFKMRQLQAAIEGVTTPAPVPPWFRPDMPHSPDFSKMPGTVDYLAARYLPNAKPIYQTAVRGLGKALSGRFVTSLEERDLMPLNTFYLSVLSLMARFGGEQDTEGCDRLRTLVSIVVKAKKRQ